ncbi:hypothetical protein SCLCIDRAFT_26564 [Scleroderma citrinum Foug A]|uniref:Sof1-like protein domain-containing protein n=1 Tax=Scleroderma citrinum Foug A TaxID=1036808 RepID=A0A0C3DX82_9AGAM|nr:hypothetical protein SCLCIDRAFT_26564 [Scleroderma citrinum Foug A]
MAATPTVSNQWTNSSLDMYKEGRPPLLGTVDIKEIEDKAREAMEDDIRNGIYGSAGTRSTDLANKNAFENYKLVPRMFVDVTNRSIEQASKLKQTMLEAQRVKEERRRKHTRAGESKPKAERKKIVLAERS